MKRTCKTCGRCLFFARGKCHIRSCKCTPVGEDAPGCPMWELSTVEFRHAMLISLEKARKKHPGFVPLPGPECASMYATRALIAKNDIESRVAIGYGELPAVLFSEVYEFLAEVANGDFDRALEEAGDVMAVLYRALNGDGKEVRNEAHAD